MPNNTMSLVSTNINQDIAKAVVAPSNTVNTDVAHGCQIRAIWVSMDMCGTGTSGALVRAVCYLIKNPGANLTPPGVFAISTSNEKKFVIKTWAAMLMRNQDGNNPYHWEGWIPIPKRYWRMGTDDIWQIVAAVNTTTGHLSWQAIYKWFT